MVLLWTCNVYLAINKSDSFNVVCLKGKTISEMLNLKKEVYNRNDHILHENIFPPNISTGFPVFILFRPVMPYPNVYSKSLNNVELEMHVNCSWMMFEQIWILNMLKFSLNISSTF